MEIPQEKERSTVYSLGFGAVLLWDYKMNACRKGKRSSGCLGGFACSSAPIVRSLRSRLEIGPASSRLVRASGRGCDRVRSLGSRFTLLLPFMSGGTERKGNKSRTKEPIRPRENKKRVLQHAAVNIIVIIFAVVRTYYSSRQSSDILEQNRARYLTKNTFEERPRYSAH